MTPTTSPEDHFRRYRDRGDPAALAAVFDCIAPQLLLLAAHVTPDAAAAEDLLQETFLQAMGTAAQWDATQPLLPWLGGILRHRAIDLARRLHHRRGPELPGNAADRGPGPAEAAASGEVLDQVQRALAELAAPYREVLVLRLVHGLEPTAIAHALGRPPNTVRVQLKRGLELLRGALPATLAGALALLLTPGRGLAAARASVLAACPGAAPLPLPRRVSWVGIGALGLALTAGAWWWWGTTVPSTQQTAGGTSPAGAASPSTSAVLTNDRVAATQPTREAAAPGAPENTTTLRGRIVSAADRAPLPGGQVTLWFGPGRFVTEDPGFRRWPEAVVARAAADGTFAIACEPAAEMRVGLRVDAPGHVQASTVWTSLKSGQTFDLGDITLVRGCEMRARVVDERGAPVPGVVLEIARRSGGVEPGDSMFTPWSSFETTSDANGQLAATMLPAPGTYGVEVSRRHPSHRVVRPTELTLGAEPVLVTDVVVAQPVGKDSVAGRVVDARGNALGGVTLSVMAEFLDMGSAVSGPDGTFWLPLDVPHEELELYLPATERRFRLLEPDRKYRRGATDVEVRVAVEPLFDVPLIVVDASTGEPVTSYGLRCELDYWDEALRFAIPPERIYFPAPPEPRPDGSAVLPQLAPGGYRLCVHPANRELSTAYLVPFEVAATGPTPVRIELQPFASLRVLVRDEAGAPVAGAEVALVHDLASGGENAALFTVEQFARGIGGGRRTAALLQSRTTDDEGRAVLRAPVNEPRLRLLVRGKRIAQQRMPLAAVRPAGDDVVVTTSARAQVVGRVEPRDLLDWIGPSLAERREAAMVRDEDSDLPQLCPRVWLQGPADERGGSAPLLPDGTFRIDAVPPGTWRIGIDLSWRMNPGFHTEESVVLGEVAAVRAGEAREVVIDVAALRPARVRGTVLVDGAAWTRGSCGLVASDGKHRVFFAAEIDGRGMFERVVPRGRYLPYVTWRDERGEHHLFASERLELAAGADVTTRVSFEARVLRVEVARADGAPAAGQQLALRCVDHPEAHRWLSTSCATDAAGVVVLDPAPPGRIEFALPGDDGARLGQAAAAAAPTAVRLQLPR